MQTSSRRGISYPSADRSDRPDIPAHIKNLVDALELDASTNQGLAANRPANPGYARYFWWATDTHVLSYWDGSTWTAVGSTDLIAQSLIDAKGDLVVGLSDNTAGRLAIGTNNYHLTADNGQPSGMKWALNALLDMIVAKGDLIAGTGTDQASRVAVGTNGQALVADSAQAAGVAWMPLVPVGAVFPYAGTTAPSGWVMCDGATYSGSDSTYAGLWAVIGTTYGGTGMSSFAVPDLRGRMIVGVGTHADVNALNKNDALAVANRTPSHHHTLSASLTNRDTAGGSNTYVPGGSTDTSGGTPLNTSPYLTLNYIIKL